MCLVQMCFNMLDVFFSNQWNYLLDLNAVRNGMVFIKLFLNRF